VTKYASKNFEPKDRFTRWLLEVEGCRNVRFKEFFWQLSKFDIVIMVTVVGRGEAIIQWNDDVAFASGLTDTQMLKLCCERLSFVMAKGGDSRVNEKELERLYALRTIRMGGSEKQN